MNSNPNPNPNPNPNLNPNAMQKVSGSRYTQLLINMAATMNATIRTHKDANTIDKIEEIAAICNSTNKVACRAKNILFAQRGSVCSMDLQDHGTGERALVQRSCPSLLYGLLTSLVISLRCKVCSSVAILNSKQQQTNK